MGSTYLVVAAGGLAEDPAALDRYLDAAGGSLVVDLTDPAVADAREVARKCVGSWLRSLPPAADVWALINRGRLGQEDAREVVGPGLAGLWVAQTESAVQLEVLDRFLSTMENELGMPPRTVPLVAVLASAGAVLGAATIARAARIAWLYLDERAVRAAMRVQPGPDERDLLVSRGHVVLASAAAGIAAPFASAPITFPGTAGLDRVRESTLALRRLGFGGRACTEAVHLPVVQRAFA